MSDKYKSVSEFLKKLKEDQNISQDIKTSANDLQKELLDDRVLYRDVFIYRAVVVVLGLTVLISVIGGLLLAFKGDITNYKLPSEIVAIGSAAVGALAGLLAPSPASKD